MHRRTAVIKAACAAVNMSYSLTLKVFDGIFGELPHILLHGAMPHDHLYRVLIRNSSSYGATMPHLRAVITIVSSALYSIANRTYASHLVYYFHPAE